MSPEQPINLIRVFDFYLALMFVISLVRRWSVYVNALRLLVAVRGRWPKLIQRLAEHQSLILNWSFFRPAFLALGLTLIQLILSRLIVPLAVLTGPQLRQEWWWVPIILVPLLPMLAVDIYFVVRIGKFDHDETVKYFDQAETWLGWKGPLVRVLTLGIINPQKMVDEEVKKNLTEYQSTLKVSLWWVSVQIALRILFGLTLWTVWAIH
ncbi:MAG: hypothetical protein L0241_30535 [Planctomycetia bacterium]|nr:hypothetical protein [Planctomycetia bacterium]